jgi:hypothetical protein
MIRADTLPLQEIAKILPFEHYFAPPVSAITSICFISRKFLALRIKQTGRLVGWLVDWLVGWLYLSIHPCIHFLLFHIQISELILINN